MYVTYVHSCRGCQLELCRLCIRQFTITVTNVSLYINKLLDFFFADSKRCMSLHGYFSCLIFIYLVSELANVIIWDFYLGSPGIWEAPLQYICCRLYGWLLLQSFTHPPIITHHIHKTLKVFGTHFKYSILHALVVMVKMNCRCDKIIITFPGYITPSMCCHVSMVTKIKNTL